MGLIAIPHITIVRDSRGQEHRKAFHVAIAPITKRIAAWAARARQRQALVELDDRLLKDIGVTREAAREGAAKPFWL